MLAEEVDFVVGVDPHRDSHALAVVHVLSGAVLFEATVEASSDGYAHAFSRSQESEADHIGLVYMARAGYDPR